MGGIVGEIGVVSVVWLDVVGERSIIGGSGMGTVG